MPDNLENVPDSPQPRDVATTAQNSTLFSLAKTSAERGKSVLLLGGKGALLLNLRGKVRGKPLILLL